MLRDICEDSGATPAEAEEILADIRRYAAGTKVRAAVERLEGTTVDRLQWSVTDNTRFYTAWLVNLEDACVLLGVLLSTGTAIPPKDDVAIARRYKAVLADAANRIGVELDVALDEAKYMELYARARGS